MYNPVTPRGGTASSIHTARIPRPDRSKTLRAQHSEGERGRERERERKMERERDRRERVRGKGNIRYKACGYKFKITQR